MPIAKKAARIPGTIERKMRQVHIAIAPAMNDYWHEIKTVPGLADITTGNAAIVMASRREHTIAIKYYDITKDGVLRDEPPTRVWGQGANRSQTNDTRLVGIYEEGGRKVRTDPTMPTLRGTPATLRVFQFQIDFETERAKRDEIRRVGPPISILAIKDGRATWDDGQQGECPDIKP
jgi:hypothetical protein